MTMIYPTRSMYLFVLVSLSVAVAVVDVYICKVFGGFLFLFYSFTPHILYCCILYQYLVQVNRAELAAVHYTNGQLSHQTRSTNQAYHCNYCEK